MGEIQEMAAPKHLSRAPAPQLKVPILPSPPPPSTQMDRPWQPCIAMQQGLAWIACWPFGLPLLPCFPHCASRWGSAKMLLGALDPSVRSQMTSSEELTIQEHMLVAWKSPLSHVHWPSRLRCRGAVRLLILSPSAMPRCRHLALCPKSLDECPVWLKLVNFWLSQSNLTEVARRMLHGKHLVFVCSSPGRAGNKPSKLGRLGSSLKVLGGYLHASLWPPSTPAYLLQPTPVS